MPDLATDIRIIAAAATTETIAYRAPIKFGGRVVTDAVLLNVDLAVETGDGRRAQGRGTMPLGNAWAWPSQRLAAADTLRAMLAFGRRATAEAAGCGLAGHPLEISHQLAGQYRRLADEVIASEGLAEPMPVLAQLTAASPLAAALHDAYGRAHSANAYDLLGADWTRHDLSRYLSADFAGERLDRYVLRRPKDRMPLYHLVGALDPLAPADVARRIDDGLPETLDEWIERDGLTHLKIKLAGDDLDWDVARVLAVDRVATLSRRSDRHEAWRFSLDFNEKCDSAEYVLEFLARVQEDSPTAGERIQYIEQPTSRDLRSHPENRMHEVARRKPVVIDEALVDLESLLLARELGYTGVALKACKGHSEALLMAAAAVKYGMFLCVQDLTCPGSSFLHSASLAARIPTVAAIEGNARQYCPLGNRGWADRYPGLFNLSAGTVETGLLVEPGLGFDPTPPSV